MKKTFFLLFFIFVSFSLTAQDAADVATENSEQTNLEDELFGGDEDLLLSEEETSQDNMGGSTALKSDLAAASVELHTQKLRIGGGLDSSLDLLYRWDDPYSKKADTWKYFTKEANGVLRPNLKAHLFFDARPTENSKLYGKFFFGYPFEKTLQGKGNAYYVIPGTPPKIIEAPTFVETSGIPNFKIHELYADFSAKDIAFFRFGKHTVKWGTGYFYSPSDVLNLTRINPQEPTADREGAISLRTHIIIPKTQHNLWFYILPDMTNILPKPELTAVAAKAEFVIKNWELGIGGWYRYKKAPRVITTLSGSIAGKVSVFGEGVFAWGSDYTYHKNNADFEAYPLTNKPFFQATLGGSYSNTESHTTIALQYYYNGFGYTNPDVIFSPVSKRMQIALDTKTPDPKASEIFGHFLEMGNRGQHYIALTLAQNKIGTEKLRATLFQQFAVSELEGTTVLKLRWNIYKFVSMTTGVNFSYPLSPKSYSKGSIGVDLGFTLGGGKF